MFESFMIVAAFGFINVPSDNTFKCFKVTLFNVVAIYVNLRFFSSQHINHVSY